MTTARRRRIVETLHGYGKAKPGDRRYGMIGVPDDVKFDRRLMNELQNMAEETARRGVEREAHEASLVAEKRHAAEVGSLDPDDVTKHEHDLSAAIHTMANSVVEKESQLPTLPRRRFPRHHSRVKVLARGGYVGASRSSTEKTSRTMKKKRSTSRANVKASTSKIVRVKAKTNGMASPGFQKKKGVLSSTV